MQATKLDPPPKLVETSSSRRGYCVALIALVLFVVFCWITFILPPYSRPESNWGSSQDKHARLANIGMPKIILVGGSNLAFGVDSPLIEKAMKMPVVNMGLSANLGLRFMLEEIKDSLRTGDVVIISPEHQLFFGLLDGCKDMFRVVQAYPQASRWLLSGYVLQPANFPALIRNFKELISVKWHLWYKYWFRHEMPDLFSLNEGSRWDYNACGDLQKHKGMKPMPFEDQEITTPIDPNAIKLLNNFYDSVNKQGVKVFLIPPSTANSSFCSSRPAIDALYLSFKQNLKIPVLADPQRYVFSRADCLNSPYHLLYDVRPIRTMHIIADLQMQLNNHR